MNKVKQFTELPDCRENRIKQTQGVGTWIPSGMKLEQNAGMESYVSNRISSRRSVKAKNSSFLKQKISGDKSSLQGISLKMLSDTGLLSRPTHCTCNKPSSLPRHRH